MIKDLRHNVRLVTLFLILVIFSFLAPAQVIGYYLTCDGMECCSGGCCSDENDSENNSETQLSLKDELCCICVITEFEMKTSLPSDILNNKTISTNYIQHYSCEDYLSSQMHGYKNIISNDISPGSKIYISVSSLLI